MSSALTALRTAATIGGIRTSLTPLQDRFAPAQFTAMTDDQKLSSDSFVEMTSGAQLGADPFRHPRVAQRVDAPRAGVLDQEEGAHRRRRTGHRLAALLAGRGATKAHADIIQVRP